VLHRTTTRKRATNETLTRVYSVPSLSTGAAVKITGVWSSSPSGKEQSHELHATAVELLGENDAIVNPQHDSVQRQLFLIAFYRHILSRKSTRRQNTYEHCRICESERLKVHCFYIFGHKSLPRLHRSSMSRALSRHTHQSSHHLTVKVLAKYSPCHLAPMRTKLLPISRR